MSPAPARFSDHTRGLDKSLCDMPCNQRSISACPVVDDDVHLDTIFNPGLHQGGGLFHHLMAQHSLHKLVEWMCLLICCLVAYLSAGIMADLTGACPPSFGRVHPACPMECCFSFYSIGVKFTSVTAERTCPPELWRI